VTKAEKDLLRRLVLEGRSREDILRRVGCSAKTVRNYRKALAGERPLEARRRRIWFVDGGVVWLLVAATSKEAARREGANQLGRGGVRDLRIATPDEIAQFSSYGFEIQEAI
jgi:hypothetical protein